MTYETSILKINYLTGNVLVCGVPYDHNVKNLKNDV